MNSPLACSRPSEHTDRLRPNSKPISYRFFPVALAVLSRIAFAATVGFDALAGSAERAAAANGEADARLPVDHGSRAGADHAA